MYVIPFFIIFFSFYNKFCQLVSKKIIRVYDFFSMYNFSFNKKKFNILNNLYIKILYIVLIIYNISNIQYNGNYPRINK